MKDFPACSRGCFIAFASVLRRDAKANRESCGPFVLPFMANMNLGCSLEPSVGLDASLTRWVLFRVVNAHDMVCFELNVDDGM